MPVGHGGNRLNVGNVPRRIADAFAKHSARIAVD